MKTLTLIGLFLFTCVTFGAAQITIDNSVFPAPGDTLFLAVDNQPDGILITSAGGNQNWDFTSLNADAFFQQTFEVPDSGQAVADFPEATAVTRLGSGLETYYRATDSRLEILGAHGADPLGFGLDITSRFTPPLADQQAPLNFEDEHNVTSSVLIPFATSDLPDTLVSQFPIVPDSFRLRLSVERMDLVDAWGSLRIPEGEYEVLRQKRIEVLTIIIEAKSGPLGWLDVSDLILPLFTGQGIEPDTTLTYRFLSREAKEPIAICVMDSTDVNVASVQFKSDRLTTSIRDLDEPEVSIRVSPNPTVDVLFFRKKEIDPGPYRLDIFDQKGVRVWEKTFFWAGNELEQEVDVSVLPPGAYWCVWTEKKSNRRIHRPVLVVKY